MFGVAPICRALKFYGIKTASPTPASTPRSAASATPTTNAPAETTIGLFKIEPIDLSRGHLWKSKPSHSASSRVSSGHDGHLLV
jgi:hypothetical protein